MSGILNIARLRAHHKRFLASHAAMVRLELENAAKAGERFAKANPGFQDVTGKTRAATEGVVLRTRRGHVLRLKHPTKIGRFMDQGTRAHTIRAKRSGMLRFYWPKIGGWFSGRQVRHPGTRAYRFVHKGFIHAQERAIFGLRSGMAQIARKF